MEWREALSQWTDYYRSVGFSLIPITTSAKAPPLLRWEDYQKRAPTQDETEAWWKRWPDANIAIVTGQVSGISVIDLDGQRGQDSAKPLNLPPTFSVKTPKGRHLYYRYNAALHTGAGFLPGVDVRSDGGYVIAPPSVINDTQYSLVNPDAQLAALVSVPQPLVTRPKPTHQPRHQYQPPWVVEAMMGAMEKTRNDTGTKLAGYFRRKGLNEEDICIVMRPFAERCTPPMDFRELETIVNSVCRYPPAAETGGTSFYGGVPI